MIPQTYLALHFILVISFGLMTSWTDYKKGIVKNSQILVGLIYSLFFAFVYLWPEVGLTFLFSALFSTFIALFFWLIDIWPPGDAKLFIVYSLLFTPAVYLKNGYLLGIDILINIFVPAFFLLFFLLLFRSDLSEVKKSLKQAFDPYQIFLVSLALFGFVGFLSKFLRFIGLPGGFIVSIILLFFVFELFKNYSPVNFEYIFIIAALVRLVLGIWSGSILSVSYIFQFSGTLIVFLLMRYFVPYLGHYVYLRQVPIDQLEPGMNLAEGIVKTASGQENEQINFEKINLIRSSLVSIMQDKTRQIIHSTESLSEEDVDKIKELIESGKIRFDQIGVYPGIEFGPYLFAGFLVTLYFQDSFVEILSSLI